MACTGNGQKCCYTKITLRTKLMWINYTNQTLQKPVTLDNVIKTSTAARQKELVINKYSIYMHVRLWEPDDAAGSDDDLIHQNTKSIRSRILHKRTTMLLKNGETTIIIHLHNTLCTLYIYVWERGSFLPPQFFFQSLVWIAPLVHW